MTRSPAAAPRHRRPRLALKALVVELDPKYADVICRRFQEYTGIMPELDGKPHDFTKDN